MNRLSTFSENSSHFSISSSPSIARSIPQQQQTAPLDNQFSFISNNRLSILSESSSQFSISSSPSISLNQQRPTAPSEAYLKYIHNRNIKNHQIESK